MLKFNQKLRYMIETIKKTLSPNTIAEYPPVLFLITLQVTKPCVLITLYERHLNTCIAHIHLPVSFTATVQNETSSCLLLFSIALKISGQLS